MAIADRNGLPLSVSRHAANHHEVRLVQLCFDFYMMPRLSLAIAKVASMKLSSSSSTPRSRSSLAMSVRTRRRTGHDYTPRLCALHAFLSPAVLRDFAAFAGAKIT